VPTKTYLCTRSNLHLVPSRPTAVSLTIADAITKVLDVGHQLSDRVVLLFTPLVAPSHAAASAWTGDSMAAASSGARQGRGGASRSSSSGLDSDDGSIVVIDHDGVTSSATGASGQAPGNAAAPALALPAVGSALVSGRWQLPPPSGAAAAVASAAAAVAVGAAAVAGAGGTEAAPPAAEAALWPGAPAAPVPVEQASPPADTPPLLERAAGQTAAEAADQGEPYVLLDSVPHEVWI